MGNSPTRQQGLHTLAKTKMNYTLSPYLQEKAKALGIDVIFGSRKETQLSESQLWRRCVNWGVNAMPRQIIILDSEKMKSKEIVVIGASYYNEGGFLSAIAVLPEYRGRGLGRFLIAATIADMVGSCGLHPSSINLLVLGSDANPKLHNLYETCGFRAAKSNGARSGGRYVFESEKLPGRGGGDGTSLAEALEKHIMEKGG